MKDTAKTQTSETALHQFNELGGNEESDPLERLRFFCSLAMNGEDWLDSEKFFNDIPQSKWKPINTAPKDRSVLLAYKDKKVDAGIFVDDIDLFVCSRQNNDSVGSIELYQPIAWQELPKFEGLPECS